ncbi:OmpH family outer membrane protein [Zooshikella ganghwensis]|uniref:OmpH family outer membrane protein n=2 Tax=Zooshikella ganghwensis TaxID=202772 RepID=A0A4V1INV2_9GAMM|nr:OmpH family outer membrane protein [Zooshikella ganghwensis]
MLSSKLGKIIGISLALLVAPLASAEMKIAVINYQKAMLESDQAKRYAKQAEAKFGGKVKTLRALEAEAKSLNQKLQKDGSAMSDSERTKLQLQLKRKAEDFQVQSKELQIEKNKADRDQIKSLKPKLDSAIAQVAKAGGYEIVLEKSAAYYVDAKHDITNKVILKLNQMR